METPSVLIEYWKLFLFKSVLSKVIYRFNVQIENPIGIFFFGRNGKILKSIWNLMRL